MLRQNADSFASCAWKNATIRAPRTTNEFEVAKFQLGGGDLTLRGAAQALAFCRSYAHRFLRKCRGMSLDERVRARCRNPVRILRICLPNIPILLGNMLGGHVMHLVDLCGAIAAIRHARCTCGDGFR